MEIFKLFSVYLLGFFFILTGLLHFTHERFFLKIIPKWLPEPSLLVMISGIAEIALGLALMWMPIRYWASWAIAAMLISFFLVHADHLIRPPKGFPYIALIVRFILQFFLIAWVIWVRNVAD